MTDYKNTVNLPHTDFPMKANLVEREPEILNHWQQINLYQRLRDEGKKRQKFILHDGPPYANGNIHLGHALNKILKDIVVRSKTLSNFDAPLVPGWDCHGLPIEHMMEKKYGKAGDKISVKEFRKACRHYAASQVEIQKQAFQRLGLLIDWEHPYLTMSPEYQANIIRAFGKIVANDHVAKGFKPVHWCIDCGSALAEAEVEYKDKTSLSIDIRFKIVDEAGFKQKFFPKDHAHDALPISVAVWTTTPWTLVANEAVALNKDAQYDLLKIQMNSSWEYLLVAKDLTKALVEKYAVKDHEIVFSALGSDFENLLVQHPFYERQVPIILGAHVTLDAGTGAVHTAPAHGLEDFFVAQAYQLPVNNPVNDKGVYHEKTPLFANLHVFKANESIIKTLVEKNTLIYQTQLQHSYPHCWRHKTPLIFRATPQWFIMMDKKGLRQKALQAINTVSWIPHSGQARITNMVAERPDWCISRQRIWGIPLPFFVNKEGELHPKTLALMEEVAKIVAKEGVEGWYELDPQTLIGADAKNYEKINDILDVWFDSGVSHFCVLEQNKDLKFPADVYLEGSDQHRGWFQSSLLTSVAMHGVAPYKTVLTHGYTIDAQGYKMSKSLGNTIEPDQVTKKMGADILRLWVASLDYRGEVTLSDEILKRTTDTYRRMRNTIRYLLANLYDFDAEKHLIPFEKMLALDQFIVDKMRILQNEIKEAYEKYNFHIIYQKLHNFCSIDLGSFYLDIIKDRQYTTAKNSLARRSAQSALFHLAETLIRLMAPIISFTAEEAWRYLPQKRVDSVFLSTWYENLGILKETAFLNASAWQKIMWARDEVNKKLEQLRAENKIGAPLDAQVTLHCVPDLYEILIKLKDELRFVLITSGCHVQKAQNLPEGKELSIEISLAEDPKCERCWHHDKSVGAHTEHARICQRCVTNITSEAGELRNFA